MTKKINKHTVDKDELLKRLESGDDGALDDFEKEAMEGFASLENTAMSDRLMKDLDKRIDETYAGKKKERSPWVWYSMAAGLALVVALSFLFVNNFKKEENLAYVQPKETPPPVENAVPSGEIKASEQAPAAQNDLSDRMVQKEEKVAQKVQTAEQKETPAPPKTEAPEREADAKNSSSFGEPLKQASAEGAKNAGPDQQPATPVTTFDKSAASGSGYASTATMQNTQEKKKKTEPDDRDDKSDLAMNKSRARKEESRKKPVEKSREEADEAPSEGIAMNETTVTGNNKGNPSPSASPGASDNRATTKDMEERNAMHSESTAGNADGKMELRRLPFFKTDKFRNQYDYLKSELGKNEKLKTALKEYGKSFRITFLISEKGKVLEAKTTLPSSCNCKEAFETILMKMPYWEPAEDKSGRAVQNHLSFTYSYE